ncbi:FAD dependent oxidoreductase [Lophium mytilinum]|uniref:FAD dependent oxidoreductase n=1 Tax=Lophium mytilinum TaxID=390894 RepID=A0A6A6R853_9PEZI|nr:FAD dependent oxidoreductase [Lophium mytilinum]
MSNTVIIGAGIVGCSTAYYLSQSPRTPAQSIHLVESSPELFQCASGLAGGFLAADWFAPSVAPLGALSFRLHKELAEKYNGRKRWGYSLSTGTSLSSDSDVVGGSGEDFLRNGTSRAQASGARAPGNANGPEWLAVSEGTSLEVISRENSTAQIDPLRFSKFLLEECRSRGVHLHQPARALSVSKDVKGELASVRICTADGTETDLPCTRLVITAGSWAPKVFSTLFPSSKTRIPIAPLAGHGLLLRNPTYNAATDADKDCHAVFATDTLGFSPELFSRVGGEIYIAGLNSTQIKLPEIATDVVLNEAAIKQLRDCAAVMLGLEGGGEAIEVMRASLCFRPVTSSGRPIIARVPDEKLGGGLTTRPAAEGGVFVAAGHGAWGISQAPGTGLCVAELIEGRTPSANITPLSLP